VLYSNVADKKIKKKQIGSAFKVNENFKFVTPKQLLLITTTTTTNHINGDNSDNYKLTKCPS